MKQTMGNGKIFKDDSRVRFFIGDVRDKNRLHPALNDVDYVVRRCNQNRSHQNIILLNVLKLILKV